MFGKWSSAVDVGFQAWAEDTRAEIMGWISENTGQHMVGNFWDNGDKKEGTF
jgi:hypothetical protein